MKKYNIYGMGAAIVDTEVVVSDSFIKDNDCTFYACCRALDGRS